MLNRLRTFFYKRHFNRFRRYALTKESLFFVDFDNTLADTLTSRMQGEFADISAYKPLNASVDYTERQENVIVLTARDIKKYYFVRAWLLKNLTIKHRLYFVPKAEEKLEYYKFCISNGIAIQVMDDCSYGESPDTLKYYETSLRFFKDQDIKHLNYSFIKSLNS